MNNHPGVAGGVSGSGSFCRAAGAILLSLAILVILSDSAWAQKGVGFSLRVVDEVAPAGGLALVRVELTEPKPISSGKIRLVAGSALASAAVAAASPSPLGPIMAAGLLSLSGDVQESASLTSTSVTVDFTSPSSTFGLDLDLPLMVVAIPVNPGAVAGATVPLTLDLSGSSFLDASGQPYTPEVKQGTFTVGGVSITRLIASNATFGPGSKITLQGVGFQSGSAVNIDNTAISSVNFVNAQQIDVTLGGGFNIGTSGIRLRNPDGTDDVFYALPELRQIGQATSPVPTFTAGTLNLVADTSADVVVNLSQAAQAPGTLNLSISNAGALSAPASVPVTAGASSVTFRVFGESAGDALLTASLNGAAASLPVHVSTGSVIVVPVLRNDVTLQVGLALTNGSQSAADVRLRAFAAASSPAGSQTLFTATVRLAPNEQVARFLSQYDPHFDGFKGWVVVSSVQPGVQALYLNLPSDQLAFAGSSDSAGSADFICPETRQSSSGDFDLVLVNNNFLDASIVLEWWSGGSVALQATSTIPAQGSLTTSLLKLFPGVSGSAENGYLRVRSSQSLTAYQQGTAGGRVIGQTPPSAGGRSTHLMLPQFVVGPGWSTEVTLVNPLSSPSNLVMTLVDDRGAPLSNAVNVLLPARGQLILQGKDVFALAGTSLLTGSLEIDSQGEILGSAVLRDDGSGRYASATPLFGHTFSEAAFAQVATGTLGNIGYFTGLALENPNSTTTDVTVEVYSAPGQLGGRATVSLAPGGRISKLLSELVPGLAPQLGGHIHIISTLPIAALEIFGDDRLDFITTVPAAVIR